MATTATKANPRPQLARAPAGDAAQEAAPQKRRRRRRRGGVLKALLLLALLLGAAGAGAWYLFGRSQPEAPLKAGAHRSAAMRVARSRKVSNEPPVFVTLEPFTVNLQHDQDSPEYLQVGLVVRVRKEEYVDEMKQYMPAIRNRVLLLLSSKKASEITTVQGKKKLSDELRKAIAKPLAGHMPPRAIDSVLFTSFVVQ